MVDDSVELRSIFGEDAGLYDRVRPGYPANLFAALDSAVGLGPGSRVLELGCGTGQLTIPLAGTGSDLTAVELSASMAAVAAHNLAPYDNAHVVVSSFEDWSLPAAPFDLVVSATAFHWIDPAVRVSKAADALRVGGALAVVSAHHVAGGTAGFFVDVQRCYERFDPATPPGLRLTPAADLPTDSAEYDESGRFDPVEFRRYEWEQDYTTEQYLDLLRTYSGHRALPPDARAGLLACIGDLIDSGYGGRVTKRYLTQLAFARKTP